MSQRVLHIIPSLDRGGAEMSLLRYIKAARELGSEHAVVVMRPHGVVSEALQAMSVTVDSLEMSDLGSVWQARQRLKQIVRRTSPNVLQGWMAYGNVLAWLARRWSKPSKVVWCFRNALDDWQQFKWPMRFSLRWLKIRSGRVHAITFNSERALSQHVHYGFDPAVCKVVHNGCDAEQFSFPSSAASQQARQQLGLPDDAMVVGHVGRFHPVKNHARLIAAWQRLLEVQPNAYLVCVGSDIHWQNQALTQYFRESDVAQIRLLEDQSPAQLASLYHAMDVFCLTSNSEGFPNVLAEAMASGVVGVTTPVGCAPEIVGATGWVASATDTTELTAMMLDCAEHFNTPDWQQRRHLARERIVQNFTWQAVAKQMQLLLSKD